MKQRFVARFIPYIELRAEHSVLAAEKLNKVKIGVRKGPDGRLGLFAIWPVKGSSLDIRGPAEELIPIEWGLADLRELPKSMEEEIHEKQEAPQ